jgi:site-specific DNA-cytosine methylase
MNEPQVLTPKRTEEGKRMRKDYEAHKVTKQRKEMQKLEPREDGISNTLTTAQKDNYLMVPSNTAEGYVQCEIGGVLDISYPSSTTRRGRVQEGGAVVPTLTCGCETTHARIEEKMESITFKGKQIHEGDGLYLGTSERFMRDGLKDCSRALKAGIDDAGVMHNYRIRKLTERECFRLMGVKDEESDKIREVVSKSQCYKLAGNSIVVDVMVHMFDQLFFGNKNTNQQLELF